MYEYDVISEVINKTADDIIDAAELPESGAVDAINLLVSATLMRLKDRECSLEKVAKSYQLTGWETGKPLSGKKALRRIIGWIHE